MGMNIKVLQGLLKNLPQGQQSHPQRPKTAWPALIDKYG